MRLLAKAILVGFALLLSTDAPAQQEAWARLDPYRNVARLVEVTALHHWFQVDACMVGVPVPEGEIRLRCGSVASASPEAPPARTLRRARHVLPGGAKPVYLGMWREVRVREELMLPDRTKDGRQLGAFGEVVMALEPARLDLRVLGRSSGGHGLVCSTPEECDLSKALWLDWEAPAGLEGTCVLHALAYPDHAAGYDAALAELKRATVDTIHRMDRGDTLPSGPGAMPDHPDGQLPPTRFALTWTIDIHGRPYTDEGETLTHHWEIDIPLDQVDRPLRFHRYFEDLGLDLVADFDLPGQEMRVRAGGPQGDVIERTYAIRLPLWRSGGTVAPAGAPWVESPRDIHELHVSSPDDLARTDIYATSLRRSNEPYRGTDAFEIIVQPRTAASEPEDRQVDVPAEVLLIPQSHDGPITGLHQTREREPATLRLDPSIPLTLRFALYVGQQRPTPDRIPEAEDRATLSSANLRGPTLGTPETASFRIDRSALETRGAWVTIEWIQDDRRLLFRGYRLPPSRACPTCTRADRLLTAECVREPFESEDGPPPR